MRFAGFGGALAGALALVLAGCASAADQMGHRGEGHDGSMMGQDHMDQGMMGQGMMGQGMMGEHSAGDCVPQAQAGHDAAAAPAGHEHGEGAPECPPDGDPHQHQDDAPGPN